MELLWNELNALRLVYRGMDQAVVDAALPSPPNRRVVEVLDYTARARIENCRADAGKLNLDGDILVTVVAADDKAEVFSFASASAFSHSIEVPEADTGMYANATPMLETLSVRLLGDERLMLAAAVNIESVITSSTPIRVLSGVSGVADMEFKSSTLQSSRRVELAGETIRISEEISSDGADDVLQYTANISIRDTAYENGNIVVSGVVTLNVLCRSADGELMQLVRGIPFRETLDSGGSAEDIYTVAELREVSVRALGTEFSLIAFDADVDFRVFGIRTGTLSIPMDAFAPSINFNCLRQQINLMNALGGSSIQHSLRENISVPDGMADIFTALHAGTRPVVTSLSFSNGEMCVDGLLFTRLIYRSSGERLYSFTEDVPFTLRISSPSNATYAGLKVQASASVTGGSGRTAQISYNIDAAVEFFAEAEVNAVVGIAECEASPIDGGIVIYNASAGETVFDIAKHFRIRSERVLELNPDAPEVFSDGDKVILLV